MCTPETVGKANDAKFDRGLKPRNRKAGLKIDEFWRFTLYGEKRRL